LLRGLLLAMALSLPVPLSGPRGRKRARPPGGKQIATKPPGRWDAVETQHQPRSQNRSPPASRLVALVAPSVAFGLGLSVLAAGPAAFDTTPIACSCGASLMWNGTIPARAAAY
jgi:hypothetical protein